MTKLKYKMQQLVSICKVSSISNSAV